MSILDEIKKRLTRVGQVGTARAFVEKYPSPGHYALEKLGVAAMKPLAAVQRWAGAEELPNLPIEERVPQTIKKGVEFGFDVLNLPSYAVGGALKYKRPSGVVRGIAEKTPVFEELPKALGVKQPAAKFAIGLGGEILTPGTSELARFAPLALAAGGIKTKVDAAKILKRAVDIENLQSWVKNFDVFQPEHQMNLLGKMEKTAKEIIPDVVNSKEMKKLALRDRDQWMRTVSEFMRDRLELAKEGRLNLGLSTRIVKGKEPLKPQEMPIGKPLGGTPLRDILPEATKKQGRLSGLKDQLITESRKILQKMGTAGQEAASRVDAVFNDTERLAGGAVADLQTTTKGLSNDAIERINRVLDGQGVPLTPVEQNAARVIRQQLDNFATQAEKVGLEIKLPDGNKVPFQPRENYLPHILDLDKLKANREASISHLAATGQFPDVASATGFVDDILNGTPVAQAYQRYFPDHYPTRYGSLEFARILDWPKEVLRYDKKVLADYFQKAAKRITQTLHFGPNNEGLTEVLNGIAREGGDPRVAEDILNRNLGLARENPALVKGIGAVRQFQAATKLGLSAISNIGQSVNTATKYGIVPTVKEIFKASSPESQDFALRAGATLEEALREVEAEAGKAGKFSKIIAPGFRAVEKFNRVVSANVGQRFALKRFKALVANPNDTKAAIDLEKLGVSVKETLARGSLSEIDLLKAGQKATNITQFKTRPIDLPPTWSSAGGKLLTQFKSFAYKHGQFVRDEVFKPALSGNIAPLTRYLVLGLVVGEAIADVKAFVRRRERPQGVERALDNLAAVGGAGIMQDAFNSLMRGPEAMLKFIAGPTVSDIAEGTGAAGLALQGKPKTLGRYLTQKIPIAGQPLANTLWPPRGAYKSRTPDLILEAIGMEPTEQARNIASAKEQGELTPYEEAQVREQISKLGKKEKEILTKNGINLPLIGQIGGLTVEQKNEQLTELQKAKALLQGMLAKPTTEREAEYSLAVDRLKRADDYEGWAKATEEYLKFLEDYKSKLDSETDKSEVLRLQNKIEDLQAQVEKYKSYGGFTKGKKGATLSSIFKEAQGDLGNYYKVKKSLTEAKNRPKALKTIMAAQKKGSKASRNISEILRKRRLESYNQAMPKGK